MTMISEEENQVKLNYVKARFVCFGLLLVSAGTEVIQLGVFAATWVRHARLSYKPKRF